jgi:hypothetical protein
MALTVFSLNHHQMHHSSVQYKFPLPLHVLIITKFVFLALLSLSRGLHLFDNHCCNTDLMPVALWEVDGPEGHITGVPNSMYLVTGPGLGVTANSEVHINYGNKGNEELLYLYGFVMDTNPNDYLMIYFPKEALEKSACNETKSQLLAELNLPLRWLLPSSELKMGFCGQGHPYTSAATTDRIHLETQKPIASGDTKPPQCLMFPEDLLTALRIVAMEEDEVYRVVSLLEEVRLFSHLLSGSDAWFMILWVCHGCKLVVINMPFSFNYLFPSHSFPPWIDLSKSRSR